MGVRLYNPRVGRFSSLDPEVDGGDNAYAYPTDPVNSEDLDGRRWSLRGVRNHFKNHWKTYLDVGVTVASFAVPGLAAVGVAWRVYRAYKLARGGIYVTRTVAGGRYVGQSCRVGRRLGEHVKSGKIKRWHAWTARVYRVKGSKTRREVAEQRMINRLRGRGVRLTNKRNPIGPKRSYLLRRTPRNWRGL